MRYVDPPAYPLLQTTCPLVILAWAWSNWFRMRVFGGGCGAGGGSVGRRGGLSMLLRWFSCDCWRAGTCLESVIGSGSCQKRNQSSRSSSYRISTGEGSNRSELIYSRYQPPPTLSSPSSPLQLRPYYISDVPPFFQPQLSRSLFHCLLFFLLSLHQTTSFSIVAYPPRQSIRPTLLSGRGGGTFTKPAKSPQPVPSPFTRGHRPPPTQ